MNTSIDIRTARLLSSCFVPFVDAVQETATIYALHSKTRASAEDFAKSMKFHILSPHGIMKQLQPIVENVMDQCYVDDSIDSIEESGNMAESTTTNTNEEHAEQPLQNNPLLLHIVNDIYPKMETQLIRTSAAESAQTILSFADNESSESESESDDDNDDDDNEIKQNAVQWDLEQQKCICGLCIEMDHIDVKWQQYEHTEQNEFQSHLYKILQKICEQHFS